MGEKAQRKESLDESNECRKYESFAQEQAQLREEIDKKNMFHKTSTTVGENLPPRLGSNIIYEGPQNQTGRDPRKWGPSNCSSGKRLASRSDLHKGYSGSYGVDMVDVYE